LKEGKKEKFNSILRQIELFKTWPLEL
jgi:hypothetical protein